MKRKIFNSKKGPVEYSDTGDGEVILAIHGAMGGVDQSEILAKTIAPEGYRVIAVSRPGYLGTPISTGRTPDDQADLYMELLQSLKINSCNVMAVSGGGYSAIFFAAKYAELCNSLIICSAPGVENDSKIPFSFKIFTLLARFKFLTNYMQKQSEKNFEETLNRAILQKDVREEFIKNRDAIDLYKCVAVGMFDNIGLRLNGTSNDIVQTRYLTYPLLDIKTPTLIIHGTKDNVIPFEKHAHYLVKNIENAELLTVENGEHTAIFTHRDFVKCRVVSFLSENR